MYSSAKLNVIQKTRSNPFSWRGQFTPELVEYFLDIHADSNYLIADPFSGSGTVLLEGLKRNLDVIGCEVNIAAYAMSKFFEIGAFTFSEKRNLCWGCIEGVLQFHLETMSLGQGVFFALNGIANRCTGEVHLSR